MVGLAESTGVGVRQDVELSYQDFACLRLWVSTPEGITMLGGGSGRYELNNKEAFWLRSGGEVMGLGDSHGESRAIPRGRRA
jgi:hypothetical protein